MQEVVLMHKANQAHGVFTLGACEAIRICQDGTIKTFRKILFSKLLRSN